MALSKAERAAIEEIKASAQATTKLCNQLLGPRKPDLKPGVKFTQGKIEPLHGNYGHLKKQLAAAKPGSAEHKRLTAELKAAESGKRSDTLS